MIAFYAILKKTGTAANIDKEFLRHVFESWVLARHVRRTGTRKTRAQVRVLLRLKVILDEGGWDPVSGAFARKASRADG